MLMNNTNIGSWRVNSPISCVFELYDGIQQLYPALEQHRRQHSFSLVAFDTLPPKP